MSKVHCAEAQVHAQIVRALAGWKVTRLPIVVHALAEVLQQLGGAGHAGG